MDAGLIVSAALLGAAGMPHCAAMCGAPCAALTGAGVGAPALSFHAARVASYAAGGFVASSSMALLASWSEASPALRPLWTLVHALALGLGLWLLWQGRQPSWMGSFGRVPRQQPGRQPAAAAGGWQRIQAPARAGAAGALWVGWPCGLLQSALMVAAMTNHPASGAAAMAAFALASSGGLLAAPWLWQKLRSGPEAARRERWVVRAAGLMLVLASGWALGHGLWHQIVAFCATL